MNIDLTPEQEQFVQSTVNSGKYSDVSEVVRTVDENDDYANAILAMMPESEAFFLVPRLSLGTKI